MLPYQAVQVNGNNMSTKQNVDAVRDVAMGIDLGVQSIGWCVLSPLASPGPVSVSCGARSFEAGVTEGVEQGKDQPRAAERRQARMPRRQHWRRAYRLRRVFRLLQRAGLLPGDEADTPEAMHALLLSLDKDLLARHAGPDGDRAFHILCYRLRARALDQRLEPHELGRALYHLAQRRGYQSNRRADMKDEDAGVVEAGIADLRAMTSAANSRTLGEYFASLDPREQRIRGRWTARDMYTSEFDAIWRAQQPHHAALTAELRAQLFNAIFFQRPLKSQTHLIGRCELVPGRKRAALATRLAQRFRMLQRVNDLLVEPDGQPARPLAADERAAVLDLLAAGDMRFAAIRKKLKLGANTRFNLERGDEKTLVGDRTSAKLSAVLNARWDEMADDARDELIEDVRQFEKRDALRRRLVAHYGFDEDTAAKLAAIRLEPGYAAHSAPALARLVELMETGKQYMTARLEAYPQSGALREPLDRLPPVLSVYPQIRNPSVLRALTELRRVVNAIVVQYGKPALVRVELARDLKTSRKERQRRTQQMRENQRAREDAASRILREAKLSEPSRDDVRKVLLADECNWCCPFTGRAFAMRDLVGRNPQLDIAHIIPRSLSLDDSFVNMTLCWHDENRNRMRNRTPRQAYSADPQRWQEILDRVRRFNGPLARLKLERLMTTDEGLTDILERFNSRQLNDTRYASRLAADYLGLLYGGRTDADGRLRVQVSAGQVTAHIRNELGLNAILSDGGEKSRSDHRHHAVDALCIALADPAMVKRLSDAAEHAWEHGRRRFAPIEPPWPGFLEDVRRAIAGVIVSRRPERRIRGRFHAESLYSKPIPRPDGTAETRIRKRLDQLSATEIQKGAIADPVIRRLVADKLAEIGGAPKQAFADPKHHPFLTAKDGRRIPIHSVRVRVNEKPWTIGSGARERRVVSAGGANHHVVLVSRQGPRGEEWADHVVSRYEAHQRLRRNEPVVKRDWPDGWTFRFSLCPGDYVEMDDGAGMRAVYRVTCVSKNNHEFRLHSDARKSEEIRSTRGARIRAKSGLFWAERRVRKVVVTPLGEVIPCND